VLSRQWYPPPKVLSWSPTARSLDSFSGFISVSFASNGQSALRDALTLAPDLKRIYSRTGEPELVPYKMQLLHMEFVVQVNNVSGRIDLLGFSNIGANTCELDFNRPYEARQLDIDVEVFGRRGDDSGRYSREDVNQRGFACPLFQNHPITEKHTRWNRRGREVLRLFGHKRFP
jgi:hypothetical protein